MQQGPSVAGEAVITAVVTLAGAAASPGSDSTAAQTTTLLATITVPVQVAIQRNPACQVPTEFPIQPPVGPAPVWDEVPNAFVGAGLTIGGNGANRMPGDFDGDGDEDFVLTDYDPRPPNGVGRMLFWRNVGGTYEDATAAVFEPDYIPDWGGGIGNHMADFNGDGALDLFKPQIGYDAGTFPGAPNTLLLSQPGGTLLDVSSTHLQPNEPDFTHGAAAADVDCDGDPDLMVINQSSSTTPPESTHLYINDGSGFLLAEDDRLPAVIAGGVTFSLDLPPGLAFVGTSADFCDIDRDGDVDLVYGASQDHENRVLVNDGFGRFRNAPATFPPDHFGFVNSDSKTFCSDLDLDGWPDVVMLNVSGAEGGSGSYVSLWLNRANLVFEEVVLFDQRRDMGEGLERVVDVNGDGWPDILLTPFQPDGAVLLNFGGDAFVSVNLPSPAGGSLVDANGDGKLDYLYPGHAPDGGNPAIAPRLWYQR